MSKEKPNMKLRMPGKDYTEPGWYFITMVVEGRRHLFGRVMAVEDSNDDSHGVAISGNGTVAITGQQISGGETTVSARQDGASGFVQRGDLSEVAINDNPTICPFGGSRPHKGAMMVYSRYGQMVAREIEGIAHHKDFAGKLLVKGKQLLPDHLHVLIKVTEELPKALGVILNGFNTGCRHAWKTMCFNTLSEEERAKRTTPERYDPRYMKPAEIMVGDHWPLPDGQTVEPKPQPDGSLKIWEDGYNDGVVCREGQIAGYYTYMNLNCWRLLMKQLHPMLFTKVWGKELMPGIKFSMIGNMFLLDRPVRVAVRISRFATDAEGNYLYPKRLKTDEEIEEAIKPYLKQAQSNAVLVTPCISPAEKAIVEAAYKEGLPVIMFCPNGFSEGYHPSDFHYEACSNGILLQLAPYKYDPNRKLSKPICEELNDMTREFSK